MNLILLFDEDFISDNLVRLKGRRHKHVKDVLGAKLESKLCVGRVNNLCGQGRILKLTDTYVDLEVVLNKTPPKAIPLTLILALPRPLVIKRILSAVTSMGVKRIHLIQTNRVEKSFWKSPALEKGSIDEQLILGLEQSKDTVLPEIALHKQFRPFFEKEFPKITKTTSVIVAHPDASKPCPRNIKKPTTLVIGPEGGFIPYEIELFSKAGCDIVHLGSRILRVETVLPALIAKLF